MREQHHPVRDGSLQEGRQIEVPASVPEDQENSIAGSSQRVGIGGAAWTLSLGEDAQQQFKPFRQCHDGSGIAAGQGIAGSPRQVMLHHRKSHLPRFPLLEQIFAAHEPLKLRELPHHLTDEIVLAEVGGATRMTCDLLR